MFYRDAVAIARIRHELRERLMAERTEGVWEILTTLGLLAAGEDELTAEHARWQFRFELLASGDAR